MKKEHSGKIYRIKLEFEMGYVFALILDYSDISEFDGILVQVYNYIEQQQNERVSLDDIINSGIMIGPMPMSKYPTEKGKYSWSYIGKTESYNQDVIFFKELRGMLNKDANWANLKPWFKFNPFEGNVVSEEVDYSEIRKLETAILNHPNMIKIKSTMLKILTDSGIVSDYYNLDDIGNRNMFLQVANTYCDLDLMEKILKENTIKN
jgi:hypothetical protein